MTIISRSQWGARAPRRRTQIGGPVAGVVRHYEGVNLGNYSHDTCPARIRGIQAFHMDRNGWDDGAYSAVVCRHGSVYAMRGPGVRTAANGTNDANARFYAVCVLMGPNDELTEEAKRGWLEARDWLRREGGAGNECPPHSAIVPTGCPGGPLRDWHPDAIVGESGPELVTIGTPAVVAPPAPPWGLVTVDGQFGRQTVRALQGALNESGARPLLRLDGDYGPATKRMLQARLNHTNGPVSIDGNVGPQTIRALQRRVGCPVDGAWGPGTTRALQSALNRRAL